MTEIEITDFELNGHEKSQSIKGILVFKKYDIAVSGSRDCTVRIWSYREQKSLGMVEFDQPIGDLEKLNENTFIVSTLDREVQYFTLKYRFKNDNVCRMMKSFDVVFSQYSKIVLNILRISNSRFAVVASKYILLISYPFPNTITQNEFIGMEKEMSTTNSNIAISHVHDGCFYITASKIDLKRIPPFVQRVTLDGHVIMKYEFPNRRHKNKLEGEEEGEEEEEEGESTHDQLIFNPNRRKRSAEELRKMKISRARAKARGAADRRRRNNTRHSRYARRKIREILVQAVPQKNESHRELVIAGICGKGSEIAFFDSQTGECVFNFSHPSHSHQGAISSMMMLQDRYLVVARYSRGNKKKKRKDCVIVEVLETSNILKEEEAAEKGFRRICSIRFPKDGIEKFKNLQIIEENPRECSVLFSSGGTIGKLSIKGLALESSIFLKKDLQERVLFLSDLEEEAINGTLDFLLVNLETGFGSVKRKVFIFKWLLL